MKPSLIIELKAAQRIYLWGAASAGHRVLFRLINLGIEHEKIFFVDSNYASLNPILGRAVLCPSVLQTIELEGSLVLVSSTIKSHILESAPDKVRPLLRYEHELIFSRDTFYKYPKDFVDFITLRSDTLNLDIEEAFTLWSLITRNSAIPGMIVEIGVYKGASLGLIATAVKHSSNKEREIIGIDTFEGIPSLKGNGDEKFANYLSDVNFHEVQQVLGNQAKLIKGFFPDCVDIQELIPIFLLHLDVDTFQSTRNALDLLWPNVSLGGAVVVHDYNSQGCPGVLRAVQEWMEDKQLVSLEVAESQVALIKITNN